MASINDIINSVKVEDIINVDETGGESFYEEGALAILLLNGILVPEDHNGEPFSDSTCLHIDCQEWFWPRVYETYPLGDQEIYDFFRQYLDNPEWGPLKWLASKQNQQPVAEYVEKMQQSGGWDIVMEALPKNRYEARLKGAL